MSSGKRRAGGHAHQLRAWTGELEQFAQDAGAIWAAAIAAHGRALLRQNHCAHATWLMAACLAEWSNGNGSRARRLLEAVLTCVDTC